MKNTDLFTLVEGPKHFSITSDIICYRDLGLGELGCGPHILNEGMNYETTNCFYQPDGCLQFELHDKQGFIGTYLIDEENLKFIQPLV